VKKDQKRRIFFSSLYIVEKECVHSSQAVEIRVDHHLGLKVVKERGAMQDHI